jgi:hypothetical protein
LTKRVKMTHCIMVEGCVKFCGIHDFAQFEYV